MSPRDEILLRAAAGVLLLQQPGLPCNHLALMSDIRAWCQMRLQHDVDDLETVFEDRLRKINRAVAMLDT